MIDVTESMINVHSRIKEVYHDGYQSYRDLF